MVRANGVADVALSQIVMKAIILMIENVVLGSLCGLAATFIRANIKMMSVTVTEKCIGQTEVAIKANGLEVSSMVTVA